MKESLLPLLACPSCTGAITLASTVEVDASRAWAEIITGVLRCAECGRECAIRRGVPRFVEVAQVEADKQATAANFGWQWQHFTQDDARYAEQLRGWLAPVAPEFFYDKSVLEAGCGKGRHTRLAAEWGARTVVGVDLSDAVETAFAATRDLPQAHVVQADIYALPFKQRTFDYAFSVGVLHHLPRPRVGFVALAEKVKVGGHLSAWVYGAENNEWLTRWVSPVREQLTSRISRQALLQLSKLPTALVYAATKLVYGPVNRYPRAAAAFAGRLFYNDYLKSIALFGWREQHTIVFDHLVAPTAHYVTRADFAAWWREINAADVEINWHNRNSWRGWGRITGGETE